MEKDKDKGPLSLLKKWLSTDDGNNESKKPNKMQYFLIVLLFGIAFMLLSNLWLSEQPAQSELPVFKSEETNKDQDVAAFGSKSDGGNKLTSDYEHYYENQLKEALEAMVGVEDVTVVVNVDATEKKVFEKNVVTQNQLTNETDREGGTRKVEDVSKDEKLVIVRDGEKEVPLVLETKKPAIRGVLVVAKGAENIQIKSWIIEAVTRVLDVPSHRVAVMPKKSKGD